MGGKMNKRIRVLHVGLDSHLGGIETYLLKISSNIDINKFKFDFLIYNEQIPCYYEELKKMGCDFHFVHSRKRNFFKNIKDLNQLFKNNEFDIVHCHFNSLSYITPSIIALKHGKKVIIHSRNAGCLKTIKTKILHNINYYRIKKLDITRVAVSDLAGKWMFGKQNFLVLNNGLNIKKYTFSSKNREKIRKELGITQEQEVILHVGAFRKQKNHDFIIKIFKEYSKVHSNSVLCLVGEGELKKEIYELVKRYNLEEKCIFLGNRQDTDKILSASDKFIFPSFYEGFPNALLEAETAGLMCVVSDTITDQAIIKGIAYKESIDEPIQNWVDKLERNKISEREVCAKKVKECKFDIADEIERLEQLYDSLL